jgi:FtsH-binding integral membrane protein
MAFAGACVGVVSFAMETERNAEALSADWFFRMAEYAALMAWGWLAMFSAAAWVRRALQQLQAKSRISLLWIALTCLVTGAAMTWASMAVSNYASQGLTYRLLGTGGVVFCFAGAILMFRGVVQRLSRQRLD